MSLSAGVLLVAIQYQWIIIHYANPSPFSTQQIEGRPTPWRVSYKYHKNNTVYTYNKDIIALKHTTQAATRIINHYFELLEDENIIHTPVTATICFNEHSTAAFISLSQSPFTVHHTVQNRYTIINDLLTNLQTHIPQLQCVLFLLNHETFEDPFLEFRIPWPIEGFASNQSQEKPALPTITSRPIHIVLNPSGHSQHVGRTIGEAFERTITLHIAQSIKAIFEKLNSNILVTITRSIGDVISPLQHINYINKLNADLFIHLGIYHSINITPEISVYTFCTHPTTDNWKRPIDFMPWYTAHRAHRKSSIAYATSIAFFLTQEPDIRLITHQSIPYRPLTGIVRPSVALEIGIPNHTSWESVTVPIAHAIMQCTRLKD